MRILLIDGGSYMAIRTVLLVCAPKLRDRPVVLAGNLDEALAVGLADAAVPVGHATDGAGPAADPILAWLGPRIEP